MLFNSYAFICGFLPITLFVFFFLGRAGLTRGAKLWLIAASIFFYAWWNWKFVALLAASICLNYAFGVLIARARPSVHAKRLLIAAVTLDLGCLAWFKYADFFIANIDGISPGLLPLLKITLPLGISFYTFTQIAFLVDVYRGVAVEFAFDNYVLFVTYFPHLIAGPILHHKQMMPQFAERETYRVRAENLVIGLTYFCIGLMKKVLLADHLSYYVGGVFSASEHGSVSFLAAWSAVFAYTFQLYFDFSGYCDMAIGISKMFGVTLPLNFNSPYKAANIIDFWRRWHMTLSQFLRDYVYIPLGGNRLGKARRHINLMLTMFLGGLWHGANWTFVIWGVLHGALLAVNHLWSEWRARRGIAARGWTAPLLGGASAGLTFFCVMTLWVFFRAANFDSAGSMIFGMTGMTGIRLPAVFERILSGPLAALHLPDVTFGNDFILREEPVQMGRMLLLFGVAAVLAFCFPNSQEIAGRLQRMRLKSQPMAGAVYAAWGVALAIVLCMSLTMVFHKSEFLYFQF